MIGITGEDPDSSRESSSTEESGTARKKILNILNKLLCGLPLASVLISLVLFFPAAAKRIAPPSFEGAWSQKCKYRSSPLLFSVYVKHVVHANTNEYS